MKNGTSNVPNNNDYSLRRLSLIFGLSDHVLTFQDDAKKDKDDENRDWNLEYGQYCQKFGKSYTSKYDYEMRM